MTPQEAADHLRHAAAVYVIPNLRQAALMGADALEATIPRQPSIPCPVCGREIVIAEHPKISASAPKG